MVAASVSISQCRLAVVWAMPYTAHSKIPSCRRHSSWAVAPVVQPMQPNDDKISILSVRQKFLCFSFYLKPIREMIQLLYFVWIISLHLFMEDLLDMVITKLSFLKAISSLICSLPSSPNRVTQLPLRYLVILIYCLEPLLISLRRSSHFFPNYANTSTALVEKGMSWVICCNHIILFSSYCLIGSGTCLFAVLWLA